MIDRGDIHDRSGALFDGRTNGCRHVVPLSAGQGGLLGIAALGDSVRRDFTGYCSWHPAWQTVSLHRTAASFCWVGAVQRDPSDYSEQEVSLYVMGLSGVRS
ncbi:hypothetical protein GCM10027456_36790 [Kineosporia babensis]